MRHGGDSEQRWSDWRCSNVCVHNSMGGTMELDPNFLEFIASLGEHEVRHLVVGGYAVAFHGHPRYTADLDVWIWIDPANAVGVLSSLTAFGFGDVGLSTEDFLQPDQVVQLGYPPLRIDLLTSIDGVEFPACHDRRVLVEINGICVPFIALDDLLANKLASGRLQDLADVEALTQDPGD